MGLFGKLFGGIGSALASPFELVMAGDVSGLQRYLEKGGATNVHDEDRRTLLGNAADLVDGFRGHGNRLEMARLLIKYDADVNAGDVQGWTPLHFAARNQDIAMATLLLESHAAIDPQDAHGNTPLWRAVSSTRNDNGEMIRLLIKAGADRNLENNYGISPWKSASQVANVDIKQHFQPQ